MKPRKPIKRKPRPASETLRIYGPPARRVWVKNHPCCVCGDGPCVNAHIKVDGLGKKSHYTNIVPLCFSCDQRIGTPKKSEKAWFALRAAETEMAWLAYSGEQ